ncbi:MAG TPA: T9SS type A sorting domain-containing protein [Ignavibacteriaceae bacterium]|nr:T9SS type A sorting domain-containing protein [Ignavibacteriaceae bacterium]
MKKYIFILILFPSFIYSQVDSLKNLLNYYPLQTGDYWEYKIKNEQMPYPPDSIAYSYEVMGDTTLSNNLTYKIITYQGIYPNHYVYNQYERIDSITGCVFRYYKDTSLANNEYKIDSLFAQPGDTINCSDSFQYSGNYKTKCLSVGIDTLFGEAVQVKTFFDFSFIPGGEYGLAKGFGNYYGASCELSCSHGSLVYAKINGVEYGNKMITGVKGNSVNPSKFILLQNYPNPFNPSTTIKYQIPKSGLVTIKIYDVLGKEVKTLVNQYQNMGSHEVNFSAKGGSASGGNAGNLSSGVYFYQLKAGNFISTKKMVLLK